MIFWRFDRRTGQSFAWSPSSSSASPLPLGRLLSSTGLSLRASNSFKMKGQNKKMAAKVKNFLFMKWRLKKWFKRLIK